MIRVNIRPIAPIPLDELATTAERERGDSGNWEWWIVNHYGPQSSDSVWSGGADAPCRESAIIAAAQRVAELLEEEGDRTLPVRYQIG